MDALVSALSGEFYVDADAVRRAVRTRSGVNLIHAAILAVPDLLERALRERSAEDQ